MTAWRTAMAVRESMLSLAARPWLLAVQLVALVVIFAAPAAIEYDAARELAAETRRLRAAGSHVVVASAGERGDLTAEACARAGAISTVTVTGWARRAGDVTFAAAPDLSFRHVRASPGVLAVLGGRERSLAVGDHAVAAGAFTASELGLVSGAETWLRAGTTGGLGGHRVAVLRPAGALGERVERTVITPAADGGEVDECWVSFANPATERERELVRALVPASEAEHVSPLLSERNVLAQRYPSRITRFGWVASGLLAAGLLGVVDWSSRGETALYRALGLRPADILVMTFAKRLLLLAFSAGVASLLVLAVVTGGPPTGGYAIPVAHCLASAALALAAAVVTSRTLSQERLAAALKDR